MKTPEIVSLTGAGISAESGIPTFRGTGGLWNNIRIEDVATPQAFARDPEKVLSFYNLRARTLLGNEYKPNPAHFALARLQRHWPAAVMLVTQNIDTLHEQAGSEGVHHMHGELAKIRCDTCLCVFPFESEYTPGTPCPQCKRAGALRPHVVWFGEMPMGMDTIYHALQRCRLFISIGTSGSVYPAAGFVHDALRLGAKTVELNLEPSENKLDFHETRYGPAGEIVPAYVEALLAGVPAQAVGDPRASRAAP
jgi:NAD-dependent deacetylase